MTKVLPILSLFWFGYFSLLVFTLLSKKAQHNTNKKYIVEPTTNQYTTP